MASFPSLLVFYLLFLLHVVHVSPANAPAAPAAPTAHLPVLQTRRFGRLSNWHGWANTQYLFAFGNSYTSTLFNCYGGQPSVSNPIGNPAYPGQTSSNGPNYISYLTGKYNQSLLFTYNLAVGGATVDRTLVEPYLGISDLRDQVRKFWIPIYSDKSLVSWKSNNSLFSIFIGINDLSNTFNNHNATINGMIINTYKTLLNDLYVNGARNFLLLNVPSIDRSPGTLMQGLAFMNAEASDISDYNNRVANMAANLTGTYADATCFVFNTDKLYNVALDNPRAFPQTAGLKNTTGYCQAYANGTPQPTDSDPSCQYPVNEYFWLNNLHPTYPIHDCMAAQISSALGG